MKTSNKGNAAIAHNNHAAVAKFPICRYTSPGKTSNPAPITIFRKSTVPENRERVFFSSLIYIDHDVVFVDRHCRSISIFDMKTSQLASYGNAESFPQPAGPTNAIICPRRPARVDSF